MNMQYFRGIMIMASILLATTVTAESVTNAYAPTVPRCRRGPMRPQVAAKCWIAIIEVPLCVFQIAEVLEGGSVFRVGKACCHAFVDLTDECKIEVFQHAKFFPVIEKFCTAIGGGGADAAAPASSLSGDDQAPPPESGA